MDYYFCQKTMKVKILQAISLLLIMMSCDSEGIEYQPKPSNILKIIIKASGNMYVALASDSTLVANQPDSTKAEVFEKIDQKNGKCALKSSAGKFVSDYRTQNNKLAAKGSYIGEWELFEIIKAGEGIANLKSSAGKIICSDPHLGGALFANRNEAKEWETFTIKSVN